jgi:hypothetical protein
MFKHYMKVYHLTYTYCVSSAEQNFIILEFFALLLYNNSIDAERHSVEQLRLCNHITFPLIVSIHKKDPVICNLSQISYMYIIILLKRFSNIQENVRYGLQTFIGIICNHLNTCIHFLLKNLALTL